MDKELRLAERSEDTLQVAKALLRAGKITQEDVYLLAYCGQPVQELLPCSWCNENYQDKMSDKEMKENRITANIKDCPLCGWAIPLPWLEADWFPGLKNVIYGYVHGEEQYPTETKVSIDGRKITESSLKRSQRLSVLVAWTLNKMVQKFCLEQAEVCGEPERCSWCQSLPGLMQALDEIKIQLETGEQKLVSTKDFGDRIRDFNYYVKFRFSMISEPWLDIDRHLRADMHSDREKKDWVCEVLTDFVLTKKVGVE